jgi:hypothetical protein
MGKIFMTSCGRRLCTDGLGCARMSVYWTYSLDCDGLIGRDSSLTTIEF